MTRRRARERDRPGIFFDHFRAALSRLPAGLIRVMPPAAEADVARAEASLGRPLPEAYAAFLRSFDGADLFHETILVAGVGGASPLPLAELAQDRPGELVFAIAAAGERFALDGAGRVIRYDAGTDERARAGSSFPRWLDATVAREQVLYGPDGEYDEDVFDPSGEDVTPLVALRQAERALKQDPGAAGDAHARGLALARLGRLEAAAAALADAAELDPENPWPWFDLGRVTLELGHMQEAVSAFRQAAARDPGPAGARFLVWGARAATRGDEAERLRAEALARDPDLPASLARAADAAQDDPEALAEASALVAAMTPGAAPRLRLRVVREPAAPPPPPDRPRRPRRAAPPRSGGSRRGS